MTLAWSPNPDTNVAGYRIYYGSSTGYYTNALDVGNSTTSVISGLTSGATYYFAVTDYDTNGDQSPLSPEIACTLSNTPPQIALTSPANGTVYYAPATLDLAASVTANGHAVSNVQFYSGSAYAGTVASPPYNFTWSGLDVGSYSLIARLSYDSGATLDSPPINVRVIAAPPKISAQPLGMTSLSGSSATMTVLVSSASPASYQWLFNGASIATGGVISGVTSPILTIGNAQFANAGSYSVIVSNAGGTVTSSSATLTVAPAPALGADAPFITSVTPGPGSLRNNFTGYEGIKIVAGVAPITITQLGRFMVNGNGGTHIVKLVSDINGTDVAGGAVSINMSGGTPGQFVYATLANPITVAAGTTNYLVSQEAAGGDFWYNADNMTVTTASVASDVCGIWGYGTVRWYAYAGTNQAFGPVDFKYRTVPPTKSFVTSTVPGYLRNNFNGYVGMELVVGASPLTITQLGRMTVVGNSGTHILKLINMADGSDVPGGAVTVAMAGGTAGQFQYAPLTNALKLPAGSTYGLVSQETVNGDWWYNAGAVTTTSVATDNTGVWGYQGQEWYLYGTTNTCFVPVDFKYVGQ